VANFRKEGLVLSANIRTTILRGASAGRVQEQGEIPVSRGKLRLRRAWKERVMKWAGRCNGGEGAMGYHCEGTRKKKDVTQAKLAKRCGAGTAVVGACQN